MSQTDSPDAARILRRYMSAIGRLGGLAHTPAQVERSKRTVKIATEARRRKAAERRARKAAIAEALAIEAAESRRRQGKWTP